MRTKVFKPHLLSYPVFWSLLSGYLGPFWTSFSDGETVKRNSHKTGPNFFFFAKEARTPTTPPPFPHLSPTLFPYKAYYLASLKKERLRQWVRPSLRGSLRESVCWLWAYVPFTDHRFKYVIRFNQRYVEILLTVAMLNLHCRFCI